MNRLIFLVLCAALPGCGTIVNGTTQKVPVSSTPDSATVTTGELKITTPGTLELKRKTPHILTISKDGYETETVRLDSVLSGAVTGNILLGGLIGWGVDAATGADSRLSPESVHVALRPVAKSTDTSSTSASPVQYTADELEKIERLYAEGKISPSEYQKLRERVIDGRR